MSTGYTLLLLSWYVLIELYTSFSPVFCVYAYKHISSSLFVLYTVTDCVYLYYIIIYTRYIFKWCTHNYYIIIYTELWPCRVLYILPRLLDPAANSSTHRLLFNNLNNNIINNLIRMFCYRAYIYLYINIYYI
jgi:hypothetical protein